jgi:hypothetical protein
MGLSDTTQTNQEQHTEGSDAAESRLNTLEPFSFAQAER